MTSTASLQPLHQLLQTAETLTASALVAHGLSPTLAPTVLAGGGLLACWLALTVAGNGSPKGAASRPPAPRGVAVSARGVPTGNRGAEPTSRGGGGGHGRIEVEHARGKEPKPRRWLLPDLVPYGPSPRWRFGVHWPLARREHRGYITAMVGAAGVAKSYLLLAFAIAAVTGKPWCGLVVNRVRRVLYVDCELDSETFRRRAFEVARGFGLKKPPRGLHYLELTGTSLASAEGWQRVDDARRRCKADAILVDSITIGALTVSVNDPGAMNRLFGSFEAWGVPVFAIDHAGKDPTKGATGSFMKYAKIRSELTLRAVRRGLIQVTHSKTNFGAQRDPFQVVSSFVGGTDGTPLTVSFTTAGPPQPGVGLEPTYLPSVLSARRAVQTNCATPEAATPPAWRSPSLAPLPLPVLTPPGTLLAWLQARPDPTEFVPSRVIYEARLLPERACKVQLKQLWEAGVLERQGTANSGYRYKVISRP